MRRYIRIRCSSATQELAGWSAAYELVLLDSGKGEAGQMISQEIPFEQWTPTLDEFSRHHEGWIATVEVIGDELGDQLEVNGRPLVGITADTKDHERAIEVIVGDAPDGHVTHIINDARRLWLKPGELPAHEAIRVESADGTTTLVTFSHIESPDHLLKS